MQWTFTRHLILYISPHSVVMGGPNRCIFFLGILTTALFNNAGGQTLQEGVDLVTNLNNDFLPRLLGALVADRENVVVGPFGVVSSLAMALEASSGKTRQEILRALNVTLEDIPTLRVGFKAYCDLFLEHSSHPEAAGAFNSVVVHSGFKLQSAFRAILARHYCANMTANATTGPSLALESHVGVMSHWKDYEKLAVYTFLSHQALRPFTRSDGISIPVPMVPLVGVFKTGVWERSRVVYLPLESNMVGLVLIMPEDPKRINSLAAELSSKVLSGILDSLQGEDLEVLVPQLTTVSKRLDLTPLLQSEGIELAFNSTHADLTRASDKTRRTFFENVKQDAYFSTSFVALNSVSGVSAQLELKTRVKRDASKVYINKPFLFLVAHRDTHLVLLAGKIENPTQVPS